MSKMMQNAKISNFEIKIESCNIKKVEKIKTSKQHTCCGLKSECKIQDITYTGKYAVAI